MIGLPRNAAKLFLALQIPFAFACSGAGPAGSGDPAEASFSGLLTFASDAAAGDAFRAGTALADARIDLVRDGRAIRSVRTGPSGAFSSALPPGAYAVRIALVDGAPMEFGLTVAAGDALFAEGRVDQSPGGAFALNVQVFRDANADAQPDDEFRLQVLDRVQGDEESGFEDVVASVEDAKASVTLCHVPPGNPDAAHTVDVGALSVGAHMAHGDTEGACADDAGEEDPEDTGDDPEGEDGEGTEEEETKVAVCHVPPGNLENPHTIEVGESAVPDHLAHGDTEGACAEDEG
ncbi:MAG TPA: carboxypeptidase-like regulatory domain-containing protein [Gemmatimonadota bacterium]|nr:carboxypeptidase-like regulatory domain-containing protein [Gemmatimonadota bacterium]